MKLSPFNRAHSKGFTLLELMISMVIMAIMSVVLFVRYPETVKRLTLANITHTVSLLFREAQVRGSAIDSLSSSLGGYGVYVALDKPDKIVLFGDIVDGTISPYQMPIGNGLRDPIGTEDKTTTILPFGYTLAKLCVGNSDTSTTTTTFSCNNANTPAITSLTISFNRPNPQPNVYINNSTLASFSSGCVEFRTALAPLTLLVPPPGHIRSVQVFSSGIIRRVNTGCE